MQRKSYAIGAALASGGLALGLLFGPVVGASVNAQTPTVTVPANGQTPPANPMSSLWSSFLDKLSSGLGIQRSNLDSAIVTAGNSTVDAAVADGTLTQEQATMLKTRIQNGDIGALAGGGRGGHRGGEGFGGGPGRQDNGVHQAMFDAIAKALNITTDELMTQLRSGQTMAQLAAAHNTTEQALTDAALAAAKAQLDKAVAAGTMTQAQADQLYTKLQQAGTQLLTPRGPGFGGGKGPRGGQPPVASPTATTPGI